MGTTKTRLEKAVALLEQIERKRTDSGDPGLGTSMEHQIIERELAMIESDILADPGALQSMLVPVRPRLRRRRS